MQLADFFADIYSYQIQKISSAAMYKFNAVIIKTLKFYVKHVTYLLY